MNEGIWTNMITLTELKNQIKQFKNVNIDYHEYYKHILLNNNQSWHFVNPDNCKKSFQYAGNYLKFLIFKRLCRQGYRLKAYPIHHDKWTEFEYELRLPC